MAQQHLTSTAALNRMIDDKAAQRRTNERIQALLKAHSCAAYVLADGTGVIGISGTVDSADHPVILSTIQQTRDFLGY